MAGEHPREQPICEMADTLHVEVYLIVNLLCGLFVYRAYIS